MAVPVDTRIKKLRCDVKSKLESGLVITDATQCVMELVENALDAKCTDVAVRLNLKNFTIEVVDNGMGISPADLDLIGERFMTSKCRNSNDLKKNMETFGYRGQAIASILDVCTKLYIKTKSELCNKTLVKVFTRERSPSVDTVDKGKCRTGTTVTVCGFMSTMPVRQKRITEIFDMKEIKNQLEYLALIHSEVSFTLRDENKGEIILESRNRRKAGLSFTDLFGMALGKFLVPLQFIDQKIEIQGFIALRRHSENNLQFFYVNKRIISKGIIHKVVNSLIDKYLNKRLTLMEESPVGGEINLNVSKNCHNVYLVQIRCPYSDFVMFRNMRKTTVEFKNWDRIFNCLKSAVGAALNYESSHIASNHVILKRKHENLDYFSKKCEMELGQLKCGIRGDFVKRGQCQLALSTKEAVTNRTTFVEEKIVNDTNEDTLIDEIKSNFSEKNRIPRPLASSAKEKRHAAKENEEAKPKILEREQYALSVRGAEVSANDVLTEFAVWLKSKIQDHCFIRNMYTTFLEEKLFSCDRNKLKLVPEKRKQDLSSKKYHIGKPVGENKLGFKEEKCLKRGEPSFSRLNSMGSNFDLNHLNNEQVKKFKKENKSDLDKHLQTKKREVSWKTAKTAFANDLMKLSSFTRSNNFIRADVKQFISGDSGSPKYYLVPGDSLKSWASHENRAHVDICGTLSNGTKAREFKKFTGRMEQDNETFNCLSDLRDNNFKKLSDIRGQSNYLKSMNSCKETELKTNIPDVNCDKRVQINLQELNEALDSYRYTTLKTVENGIHYNEITANTPQDTVMDDGVKGKVLSHLEINLSKSLNGINYSYTSQTAQENPRHTFEELISFNDLNRNKKDSDINVESSNYREKYRNETTRSNIRLVKSEANNDQLERSLSHSFNHVIELPSQSSNLLNLENLFVTEETVTQNLPDTLTLGSGGYINNGDDTTLFSYKERYSFIPKGLSPGVLEKSSIKYGSVNKKILPGISKVVDDQISCELFTKSLLPDECIEELKQKTVENMIYYESEVVTSCMTKTESKISASLSSFAVEKGQFSNVKVIGQWDKKFIIVRTCPLLPDEKHLLFVFDQHAVDERIRLEKLLKDSRDNEGKFLSVKCDPPVRCKFEESTLRLIPLLETILLNFGVKVLTVDLPHLLFVEIPAFLIDDHVSDIEIFLKSLVNNIVEEFSETRGARSTIPGIIYNKICGRACKSAVKFNDVLSPDEMLKMINDLVACQSPFHCAHGRPSTVPLLDLAVLQYQVTKREEKLNFKNLRKVKES